MMLVFFPFLFLSFTYDKQLCSYTYDAVNLMIIIYMSFFFLKELLNSSFCLQYIAAATSDCTNTVYITISECTCGIIE